MTVSRRNFLRTTVFSALGAGLSLSTLTQAFGQKDAWGKPEIDPQTGHYRIPQEAKADRTFYFTHSAFAPYVGGVFTIYNDIGSPLEMTLVKITDCRTSKQKESGEAGECIALQFRHQSDEAMPQGTRDIEHGALGKFALFLVPVASKKDVTYTAIINHMRPSSWSSASPRPQRSTTRPAPSRPEQF